MPSRGLASSEDGTLRGEERSTSCRPLQLAGLSLWWSGLAPTGSKAHAAAGFAALLVSSVHMTFLGTLLLLRQRPLFARGEVTCLGVELISGEDQHLSGSSCCSLVRQAISQEA